MDIRVAILSDVDALLALWASADAIPSATDDVEGVRLAVEAGIVLVAEERDVVVGSVIAGFDGWRGNLYRLAVRPAHRRGRVATRLVEAAEQRLRDAGCRRITALVVEEEAHATAFWRSVGYSIDERIVRYVKTTAP